MYIKYGTYQHTANLASCSISSKREHNPRTGRAIRERRTVTVQGFLRASTQANMKIAIDALIDGYRYDGYEWGLYHDNGDLSSHSLPLSGLLAPIRVVEAPSFPEGEGAEYATQRSYSITLEGLYALSSSNQTLEYSETLAIRGTGGPRFAVYEVVNGSPVSQTLASATVSTATQSGKTVGLTAYVTPPQPIWPSYEHGDRRAVTRESPMTQGLGIYQIWTTTYSYEFSAPVGLQAFPNY